ncbi:hypothetical protein ABZX12_41020 [Kribbella sp. NPDC003505]|uniref:hypothetical protein n=1 Tax=Kribbella sp. NPDC003505 TaxID=3154448 RepID=UPI0033AFE1E9
MELQNMVEVRSGRRIPGNSLVFFAGGFGPGAGPDEVRTHTATSGHRVLRHAAFEALADLEAMRARTGGLDPHASEGQQAFIDAAYYLIQ